jgi:hypothetical protein
MFRDIMERFGKRRDRKRQGLVSEERQAFDGNKKGSAAMGAAGVGDSSDISNPAGNLMGSLMGEDPAKDLEPTVSGSIGSAEKRSNTGDVPETAFETGGGFDSKNQEEEREPPFAKPSTPDHQQGVQQGVQQEALQNTPQSAQEGIQESAQPMPTDPYAAYKARQELRVAAKDPEESLAGALSGLDKTALIGAGANTAEGLARKKRRSGSRGVNSFFGSRF